MIWQKYSSYNIETTSHYKNLLSADDRVTDGSWTSMDWGVASYYQNQHVDQAQ